MNITSMSNRRLMKVIERLPVEDQEIILDGFESVIQSINETNATNKTLAAIAREAIDRLQLLALKAKALGLKVLEVAERHGDVSPDIVALGELAKEVLGDSEDEQDSVQADPGAGASESASV